ncbi:sensor histidine kinase [Variovorax sp. OV329]|uniref:sensor histidine kinase n=1 Tax=Variovorax sp. OV329 TaxID=1882825 RepID=UPI0008E099F1|nr:sensor histidine kinase [Variovorax sp. OV329]SFM05634.1 two-component system, OmpR family, sensor histidine kinase TctE [Variovorax sp. OV329]
MATATPEQRGARFGIRARLLTLLIPCILALLAFDSWNDLGALRTQVQAGYDQAMLDTGRALQRSVVAGPDGTLRLDSSAAQVLALFESGSAEHKHLHVDIAPLDRSAPAQLLMGDADLPPPGAGGGGADPQWYDSVYRGNEVRMLALRSELRDGQGRPWTVTVQAAEGTKPRAVAESAALRQALVRDARMVVLVVVLVALGVTWSLRPLRRLRREVRARRGQAPQPLTLAGVPREVAPLVDAINEQVASYRELLDAQSQFLADASHQLRTPLAIMLTQASVALREKEPAQMRTTLRAMVTQLERSRRLSEQLLSLAHASEVAPAAGSHPVADLNAIARDVVLQHLQLAHEKEQDLGWIDVRDPPGDERMPVDGEDDEEADAALEEEEAAASDEPPVATPPAVPVRASAPELHEVLANLVHNAIAHTPEGGHITVRVSIANGQAQAEVSDDGPGIAPERRDEVFGRFRQGGEGKGSRGSSTGLGLAIARAYARRNGGDIVLADAQGHGGKGLRAILQLPLAEGAPASVN